MTKLVADTLTVFIATRLVNPTNARPAHWSQRSSPAKRQREAVATTVWAELRDPRRGVYWHITATARSPKAITLTAYVARKFDDDGLQAACKSIRDGLQDCGLIQSDGPDSGHVFEYHQVIDRTRRGVAITVRLREGCKGCGTLPHRLVDADG